MYMSCLCTLCIVVCVYCIREVCLCVCLRQFTRELERVKLEMVKSLEMANQMDLEKKRVSGCAHVCVCVCVHIYMCVCVCVCVREYT